MLLPVKQWECTAPHHRVNITHDNECGIDGVWQPRGDRGGAAHNIIYNATYVAVMLDDVVGELELGEAEGMLHPVGAARRAVGV